MLQQRLKTKPQQDHQGVLTQIKTSLASLRATSVRLDLTSIRGIMLGIIATRAPAIFKVTVSRLVHGNYIWDHFQCQESYLKKFLKEEIGSRHEVATLRNGTERTRA
jgi:hypothetical protein